MPIGAAEYKRKVSTLIAGAQGGGLPAPRQCVAQGPVEGAILVTVKNMGDENVVCELLRRGLPTVIAGENVAALRVGATNQFQGYLVNSRIRPGTFTCTDAGGGTQTVVDNGLGNILNILTPFQVVGTIDYETGAIDFTWMAAFVGAGVTAGYRHTGWLRFAAPITGTVVMGGGEFMIPLLPAGGDNYVDGIKGCSLLGLMAYSAGVGSMLRLEVDHAGPTDWKLTQTPTKTWRNLNSPLPSGTEAL